MANANFSQKSYSDYVATCYFNALNVEKLQLTPKVVEVAGVKVPLIHVSGVQRTSGLILNADIWPRNEATEADILAMFDKKTHVEKQKGEDGKEVEVEVFDGYAPRVSISEMEFRIGYWPDIDENGKKILRESAPKWIAYYNGDKRVVLSGEKREYQG